MFNSWVYHCSAVPGNFVCAPNTDAVKQAFAQLQTTVKRIASQMAALGRLDVPRDMTTLDVDGAIGKITSLGVQVIGAAFAKHATPPPAVTLALAPNIPGEETVRRVAQNAIEIEQWFRKVEREFPEAVGVENPLRRLKPIGAVAIGMSLLGVAGLIALAVKRNKRNRESR